MALRPANASIDRLRADIDSGRTGEKVNHPDPAAAPLGTDEEAAGTPVPKTAVAQTSARERRARPDARWDGGAVMMIAAILAIALALMAGFWIGAGRS